jgi:hypothetical protein
MIILFLIFHPLDFLFFFIFMFFSRSFGVCIYIYIYIYIFILLRVVLLLWRILTIFDSFGETLSQLKV